MSNNILKLNHDIGLYTSTFLHIWGYYAAPGRALNFFSGRGGACALIFTSEGGVLWTEIFKFGGLRAKIWAKIEAVEAKISIFFLKGGSCELTFRLFGLKWDPCGLRKRSENVVFRAAHLNTPFLGQCPRVCSYWDRSYHTHSSCRVSSAYLHAQPPGGTHLEKGYGDVRP